MAPKVAIIGMDGVRLDVLQRFREDLPNIHELLGTGAYGNLETVLPGPHSSAAWTSFSTGVNPGKHGIGDWRHRDGYEFTPVTGEDIGHPRFWEYLSQRDRTVGVFNIPLTSPPTPINGALVTSWTSSTDQYAYPQSFQQQLEEIGYHLNADFYSHDDPIENLVTSIEKRRQGVELFLDQYDWDLLVAMFYETEQAHHQFASFIDPEHPLHDPEEEQKVKRVYEKVDEQIGRLRERFDDDTTLILMSDHGFCPIYERIYVNRILEKYDYYQPPVSSDDESSSTVFTQTVDTLKSSQVLRNTVRKLGTVPIFDRAIENVISQYREDTDTKRLRADWSNTLAVNAYEHGGIYLNTEDRPEGVVPEEDADELIDDIIEDLESDPYLGDRVANVHRRENLFTGENVEELPEVVVEFENGFLGSSGYDDCVSKDANELRDNGQVIGFHTLEGFFIADGPDVASGEKDTSSILDIAATVHHLFGAPVPRNYDGEFIQEVFDPDSEPRSRSVEYTSSDRVSRDETLDEDDREAVEEQLQDMGYL